MHHSEDRSQQSPVVTCYVDESSTDDKVLPHGVLGAVLFNESGFIAFDREWSELLRACIKLQLVFVNNVRLEGP